MRPVQAKRPILFAIPTGKSHFLPATIKRSLLLGCLLSLLCTMATGRTFYVDAEQGSDLYSGTSASYQGDQNGPWKTISKVNTMIFAPGDSLLFKRGQVWTDGPLVPLNGGAPGGVLTVADSVLSQPIEFQLVDPQNHNSVYLGAYGDGPKPRIECLGGRLIIFIPV